MTKAQKKSSKGWECPRCGRMVERLYIDNASVQDPDDTRSPIACRECLTPHKITDFQKSWVEGQDAGMIARSNERNRPTDAQLEAQALEVFKLRGLRFPQVFDGVNSYIHGFWAGWRK